MDSVIQAIENSATEQDVFSSFWQRAGHTVGIQQTFLELDSAAIYHSVLNWTHALSKALEVNDEGLFHCI